jgi:DNA-binding transcriptional ArsR family regulator
MAKLRRVLWYLLGGTRGGPLRIRILELLRERPYNTNQLAEHLDVDYKTVQHHLEVLEENEVVTPSGDEYGAVFLPTPAMEETWDVFEEIAGKVGDEEGS